MSSVSGVPLFGKAGRWGDGVYACEVWGGLGCAGYEKDIDFSVKGVVSGTCGDNVKHFVSVFGVS